MNNESTGHTPTLFVPPLFQTGLDAIEGVVQGVASAGSAEPAARIWRALLPAVVLSLWFLVGLGAYLLRVRLHGEFHDADMESKGHTVLLGRWIRRYFVWVTRPVWRLIEATGIPANAITTLATLIAAGSGIAFAAGHFALGGWCYIFSGILDVFDGRIARQRQQASAAGAMLDSVADRYADAAVLCGLAWYYRHSWVLLPVLAALTGGFLVSYVRARGEGTGVHAKVGMMQRPERIVYLGVATALSPVLAALQSPEDPSAPHWLAIVGIVFLAVTSQWTALQRLRFTLAALAPRQLPKLSLERDGVPRSLAVAALATAADFAATALGCGLGGVIAFLLGRSFAFSGGRQRALPQARRFVFVSATSLLWNSAGVGLFLLLPQVEYHAAWLIVRGAVFSLWNYPLQRDYVFGPALQVPSTSNPLASAGE
jgi:phosphatidylglycerophosphate synthase/putative flippase GtrA